MNEECRSRWFRVWSVVRWGGGSVSCEWVTIITTKQNVHRVWIGFQLAGSGRRSGADLVVGWTWRA